jgi:hypothetical protein
MTAFRREAAAHLRASARDAAFGRWLLAASLLGWAGSAWADTLAGAL